MSNFTGSVTIASTSIRHVVPNEQLLVGEIYLSGYSGNVYIILYRTIVSLTLLPLAVGNNNYNNWRVGTSEIVNMTDVLSLMPLLPSESITITGK